MMSLSLYTVIVFAVCCAILGVILLRIGVRGKLISPNPHCRKCKFDLAGHALDDPTPCPECGTILRTQTPSIIIGRYKARKLVLVAAALFLITSIASFAWPKVSKLPSVQNINIYDHFPESLLVKLATGGDDEALQTLHDRLIPGKVSTQSLQTLIDHAFKVQADKSREWDTRLGDVLMYAMVFELLSEEQLDVYLRASIEMSLNCHDLVGSDVEIVYFETGKRSTGVFNSDFGFENDLKTADLGLYSNPEANYLMLEFKQYPITLNDESIDRDGGWVGGSSMFSLSKGNGGSWRNEKPFPLSETELKLNIGISYTLTVGEKELYSWEDQQSHIITRSQLPVSHIAEVTDPTMISEFAQSIYVNSVSVPIKIAQGEKHEQTSRFGYSIFHSGGDHQRSESLIGRVVFRVGVIDLELPKTKFQFISFPERQTESRRAYNAQDTNLDLFKNNRLFWMQAVMKGTIDIVIYPEISEYAKNPQVSKYIATPVIFRDVPITRYQPEYSWIGDQDGNRWQEWRWSAVGDWDRNTPTYGEILGDQ